MNSTTITEGQSLVDVALQELGSVAALFDLADAAGLAITDELEAGQVLMVPASAWTRPDFTTYFRARAYRINTGTTMVPSPLPEAHDFDFPDFNSSDWDTN